MIQTGLQLSPWYVNPWSCALGSDFHFQVCEHPIWRVSLWVPGPKLGPSDAEVITICHPSAVATPWQPHSWVVNPGTTPFTAIGFVRDLSLSHSLMNWLSFLCGLLVIHWWLLLSKKGGYVDEMPPRARLHPRRLVRPTCRQRNHKTKPWHTVWVATGIPPSLVGPRH